MHNAQPTLAELFHLRPDQVVDKRSTKDQSLHAELVDIATKASGFVAPPTAGTRIFEHLESVLTPAVGTVLANVWNKRAEIRKYADKSKYPRGKPNYVPLATHDVKWEVTPTVRLIVNGAIEHTVKFTLAAKFHIDGVLLEIENGRIMTISTGKSRFEGKLTYGKLDLINRKSDEYVFPGELGLGDGIIISA
jgi:hypothetical protein